MIEIKGAHNIAICFCKTLEEYAEQQIKAVCDQEAFENCKIRIMPDVHAGMGCVIGTTMTVEGRVVPGMVGVDIGCGMETARIGEKKIDFKKLDDLIRNEIPCGREIRETFHRQNDEIDLASLRCISGVKPDRARRSIGTHGAGRLMSRAKAFETLSLDKYRGSMKGIFSTCVIPATLDESPMIDSLYFAVSVIHYHHPRYNQKTAFSGIQNVVA